MLRALAARLPRYLDLEQIRDCREALDRIVALYDIEREVAGKSADIRLAARQNHSKAEVKAFRFWAEAQLTRIPGKGDLAGAFRYGLSRWSSFCLFLEDGRNRHGCC